MSSMYKASSFEVDALQQQMTKLGATPVNQEQESEVIMGT